MVNRELIKLLQTFDENLEVYGVSNCHLTKEIEIEDISVKPLKYGNQEYKQLLNESNIIGNKYIRKGVTDKQILAKFDKINKMLEITPEYHYKNVLAIKTFGLLPSR